MVWDSGLRVWDSGRSEKKFLSLVREKSVFRNSISLNTVDPESQVWRGRVLPRSEKI